MTSRPSPTLLLFLVLFLASSAPAEDWLIYLRDLAHTSYNPVETKIGKESVKSLKYNWVLPLRSTISAAPTVVEGTLYVGAWDGFFYAIDGASGEVRWRTYVGVAPPPNDPVCFPGIGVAAQATVAGDVVYVAGGDSSVYALSRATGDEFWRVKIGDANDGAYLWASLFIYNGSLYVGLSSLGDCPLTRAGMVRIDLANPKEPLFRYLVPEGERGAGVWSTPAVDVGTNTLFLTTGTGEQDKELGIWGGTFLSLDATTLEIKAHYFLPTNSLEDDIEWGSSPTLFETMEGDRLVAATGKDGIIYALQRETLEVKWTRQIAIGCICPECGCGSLSTPAFDGKRLYVGAGAAPDADFENGSVYALDPATGAVIWKRLLQGTVLAPVTVANGVVYVSSLAGLESYDADSGEPLWAPLDRVPTFSQPVVCDGVLYVTFADGGVVRFGLP